ncbi:pentraxin fusion protein, partial [Biomphalaria glabrata]
PIRTIKVFFKTFGVIFECQDLRLEQINKETTDVFCTLNVTIQEMTVTGDSVKSLCSLYVSGGRNVALKQPTRQTSTYKPNDKLSDSEHAVDGNVDNRFEDGQSCTHTDKDDPSPSWAVTFNTSFVVNQFILYNR